MNNKNKKLTLKAIRINNGWSQEKAAQLYNVSKDTISNYENYKTFPDVPVIEKILQVTGLKYDDIIFLPINYGLTVEKQNENLTQELDNHKEN